MNLCHDTGPQPKTIKVRDRKYLDSFNGDVCWGCGSIGTTVAAHVRDGELAGMGSKPDDDLTVPLCASCHADQEANRGAEWWLENVLKPILRRRYVQWKRK